LIRPQARRDEKAGITQAFLLPLKASTNGPWTRSAPRVWFSISTSLCFGNFPLGKSARIFGVSTFSTHAVRTYTNRILYGIPRASLRSMLLHMVDNAPACAAFSDCHRHTDRMQIAMQPHF
jgi:hypothetical protein